MHYSSTVAKMVASWNRRRGKINKKTLSFGKAIGLWGVNLPCVESCPGASSLCLEKCYCQKFARLYKGLTPAHRRNMSLAKKNPYGFCEEIINFCQKNKVERFRFHSFGDIFDINYIDTIKTIVESCPDTEFLIFTKVWCLGDEWMDGLSKLKKIRNMHIMLSYDDSTPIPPQNFQKSYMSLDRTIKGNSTCPKQISHKKCSDCKVGCFDGRDVILADHS